MKEKSLWDRGYAITTGRDPYEAYMALVVLEKAAEIQIKARAFGGVKELSPAHARKERRKFLRKYSKPGLERRNLSIKSDIKISPEGNSKIVDPNSEGDINAEAIIFNLKGRIDLVHYGNELVKNGLVQGTWGNISVRIDEEYMLTTPSGLDYDECSPEDMVKVNLKSFRGEESLNSPTSEKRLHGEIYKNRDDVGAVVHTHSKYCSLLAACRMPLEVRDRDIAEKIGAILMVADYGEAGSIKLSDNVIQALGDRKGCIMSNHGMVAVGTDLDEAFENAIAMEEAARILVNHRMDQAIKDKEKE